MDLIFGNVFDGWMWRRADHAGQGVRDVALRAGRRVGGNGGAEVNEELIAATRRVLALCDQLDNASFDLQDYRLQLRVQETVDQIREMVPEVNPEVVESDDETQS